MEKKLMLLGLLLSHGMHGYQLNEMLQQNPATPITLKKSNAYKLLNDMEADDWVSYTEEQEGNRPPRRVYAVTEKGETAFYRLLRENLSSHLAPEFPGVVGLDFLYLLHADEAAALLASRLEVVREKFAELDQVDLELRQSHLAAEYLHKFYTSEIEWLIEIIQRLQSV